MNFTKLNMSIEEEIQRLSSMDVKDECFQKEIERGQTIANLSKSQIRNVCTALQIEKFKFDAVKKEADLPKVLRTEE